jgi:hypothetical protein
MDQDEDNAAVNSEHNTNLIGFKQSLMQKLGAGGPSVSKQSSAEK